MGPLLPHSLNVAVTGLIILLFAVAGVLLVRGLAFARGASQTAPAPVAGERRTDMRLEVLWTGLATALLLGIFLYVH